MIENKTKNPFHSIKTVIKKYVFLNLLSKVSIYLQDCQQFSGNSFVGMSS